MKTDLTAKRLRELLHYDPETGVFTWIVARPGQFAGVVAGTKHIKGYITICIDRSFYLAHRLAWLYMTGGWPQNQIDHRDLDKANNRWTNLRLATNAQNHANKPGRSDSASGIKGVYPVPSGRWVSKLRANGHSYYLGTFDSKERALDAHRAAAAKHHGEFARTS